MKINALLEACEKDKEGDTDNSKEEDQLLKDLKAGSKKPDLKNGAKRVESQNDLDQADVDVDADGPIRSKDFPVRNRMDASALKAAVEGCEADDDERIDGEEKDEDMTPEIGDKIKRSNLGKVGKKEWPNTVKGGKATENFAGIIEAAEKKLKKLHGKFYKHAAAGK